MSQGDFQVHYLQFLQVVHSLQVSPGDGAPGDPQLFNFSQVLHDGLAAGFHSQFQQDGPLC